MEIYLIVSINIEGKEQTHIWAHLFSSRPEKVLVQPRTYFPTKLHTTIGLIKNVFHLPTKIPLLGTLQP